MVGGSVGRFVLRILIALGRAVRRLLVGRVVGLRDFRFLLTVGTGERNEEAGAHEGVEVGRQVRALTVVLVGTAVGSNT